MVRDIEKTRDEYNFSYGGVFFRVKSLLICYVII
jgi:hypothetical protein